MDAFSLRLFDKIIPEPMSGCWLWLGAYDRKTGYGTTRDRNGKVRPAHCVVYCEEVGPITNKWCRRVLDHLCRNTACVNPDHLEPVTHRENLMRGVGPARSRARMLGNELWKLRT